MEDMAPLKQLADAVRRRTPPGDGETHRLLSMVDELILDVQASRASMAAAWGEADHDAWQKYRTGVLQSLVVMTGVTGGGKDDPPAFVVDPAVIARLATEAANAAVVDDRQRRREAFVEEQRKETQKSQ